VTKFVSRYFYHHLQKTTDILGKITNGMGGSGSSGGGISGSGSSGGNVWVRSFSLINLFLFFIKVRAGKKFLPVAFRYGKRYYQRRKYNKGMYAGIGAGAGAGAGYYAGGQMDQNGNYYPQGKERRSILTWKMNVLFQILIIIHLLLMDPMNIHLLLMSFHRTMMNFHQTLVVDQQLFFIVFKKILIQH
jgi:hypothetical protein